jgi:hypothetical protein
MQMGPGVLLGEVLRIFMRKTITAILVFACSALAQAEVTTIPNIADGAMKSRTCGLVLLSEGRAFVRANKPDDGMAFLVSAFALLQDGRSLEDKVSARTASQALLNASPEVKDAAVIDCRKWLAHRKDKPDFPHSPDDKMEWAGQAMMTLKTEKMPPPML